MRAAAMTSDKEGFDGNLLAALGSKLRKTKGASVADRLALERQELAKLDGRALRANFSLISRACRQVAQRCSSGVRTSWCCERGHISLDQAVFVRDVANGGCGTGVVL